MLQDSTNAISIVYNNLLSSAYFDLNLSASEIVVPNLLNSFIMGGVDYIYETSSSLLSGGLVKYNTGESISSLISWPEFIVLSNTLGTLGYKYVNDTISLSLLSGGYDSLMHVNYSSPAAITLNNPEVVTLTDSAPSLFNELFIVNNALVRSDFINTVTLVSVNLISYLTVVTLIYLFVLFYFYTNNKLNSSESCADNDYLSIWALTESEKELGSADDLILLVIVITYIFGWFFGANFYFIISKMPEFLTFVYSVPGIFYVVFSIPTYLLYDYGIFYGTYLRGASISSFFLYEFGYDIIMICVFYIRLALQAIRLVLMAIACASYYDYVMFYNYKNAMFIKQPESIVEVSNIFNTAVFWFLIKVPGTLLYIAYEVLHLWFILISQTMSFFAMIFWLFLYLYSFFLIITVEGFFHDRRTRRMKLINDRLLK